MNDRVKLLAVVALLAFVVSTFLGFKGVTAYKAHKQEAVDASGARIDTRAIRPLDRSAVMQICIKAAEKGEISGCRPDYSNNSDGVKFRVVATSAVIGEIVLSEYPNKESYRAATKSALAGVLSPRWKNGVFEMAPTAMVVAYADSKVHDVTKSAVKEALNAYELQLGGKAIY